MGTFFQPKVLGQWVIFYNNALMIERDQEKSPLLPEILDEAMQGQNNTPYIVLPIISMTYRSIMQHGAQRPENATF